jgi:hypothetical protein
MCHVYGATIDVDRFFLKGKELLKQNLKIILVEKKKLEKRGLGLPHSSWAAAPLLV